MTLTSTKTPIDDLPEMPDPQVREYSAHSRGGDRSAQPVVNTGTLYQ
ncbi:MULTISPECIES: hypothetical protein [unclassified Streptomyces]|nr:MULTISPECIES: hypothetical protein [unclassified Streptomyces]MYZ33592.1 hypothetical protein [Streptomyces sp. SID4917]SCF60259.1 hypothetical protein GA0115259_100063 [Streptomyces sp. MnatMP-M17]